MKAIRKQAMDLLARREHSYHELSRKLMQKGHDHEMVKATLDQLIHENLQSDSRFCESYLRSRVQAGYGPLRIKVELKQRGISESIINAQLPTENEFWWKIMVMVWRKKFHGDISTNQKSFAQQARFLMQRGFAMDAIQQLLRHPLI